MHLETKKLLWDVLESVQAIIEYTEGKCAADLSADRMLRMAVYHEFMIVGEALSKLRPHDPQVLDQISESHRIIGFRNQLVHGYREIKHDLTWRIIETKLPVLRSDLHRLGIR